ncbi:MAG: transposase [Thermodesulfovibrionia bacterium]|nr:transposase [Thermodesulfovibrionia bacterium]
MPDLKRKQAKSGLRRGIFADDRFIYDKETDTYGCPAGKRLKRKSLHEARQGIDYAASKKECGICELRPQCTKNKAGRTVKRHLRQQEIDCMRALAGSAQSKKDIKTRQHPMERSFARARRYGFKRARWRGLWRVQIQEYITATIQNIEILIKYGRGTRNAVAVAMEIAQRKGLNGLFDFFNNCIGTIFGKEKNRQPILCCH